jgi:hypothetical protein
MRFSLLAFKHRFWALLFCWLGFAQLGVCQNVGITLSRTELAPGQSFSITCTSAEDFATAPTFPDIRGMLRQGASKSSSTTIVNGQTSSSFSITQRYLARAEGLYVLKAFSIKAGSRTYNHAQATITVKKGAAPDVDPSTVYDPYEDFFGSRRSSAYASVKEDAFLAVDADKEQVWVGEGFTLTLSLYVAEDNRADMDFFDLNGQITEITKKIRPDNCWEESFGITNIEPRRVSIEGKAYQEYRIWQSAFYPLEAKPIKLPRIGLKMVKYESAIDPFFGGLDRKQVLRTFYAKPVSIAVREVPPSPYGRTVPVGYFKLVERIGRNHLATGESVSYQFIVKGEGNIAAIDFPLPSRTDAVDIYPPSTLQNITRDAGRVTGSKTYTFLLQPNVAGKYPLKKLGFTFPYFDPKAGRYAVLESDISLHSLGVARKEDAAAPDDDGYLSQDLIYLDASEGLKVAGNIVLLGLALAMAVGLVWRGKK